VHDCGILLPDDTAYFIRKSTFEFCRLIFRFQTDVVLRASLRKRDQSIA